MNAPLVFRRRLLTRVLALIAVSLPAAPGCKLGVSSCGDPIDPIEGEVCFTPVAPDGGGGGGGGAGGGGAPVACPSRSEAKASLENESASIIDEVRSDATVKNGQCCYDALRTPICEGRPYLVDDVPRTADPVRGPVAASGYRIEAPSPRADALEPAVREALAAQWTRDGLFEHASVASFGRFALELLAAGAPAALVEDAHRAALDEVRHARLCFDLASAYAGEAIAPGAFPFEGRVEVMSDLASIASRAAREGCIGETIAAAVAAEQLAGAVDPAVRAALSTIAEDEARHAELAWRAVAWAIRTGGPPVARAVAEVFAAAPSLEVPEGWGGELAEHGRLGSEQLRATAARALEEIVRPSARALLAAGAAVVSTTGPRADWTAAGRP